MKSLRYRDSIVTLTSANFADRAALSGGAATQLAPSASILAAAQGRSAGRCELDEPRSRVRIFDATPMPQFRDADKATSYGFLAHGIAPPASPTAGARPEGLPEWKNAALPSPPTPRK